MKKAYQVLARLISALVVVQAAAIAYGAFAIDKVIEKAKDHGNTISDASSKLDGGAGYGLHALIGTFIIPPPRSFCSWSHSWRMCRTA